MLVFVNLWIFSFSVFCFGQDFNDDYQSGDMGTEAPVAPVSPADPVQPPVSSSDNQSSLQSVTSMDQLLELLHPEYSLLQQCLRRNSQLSSSSSFSSYSPSRTPLDQTDEDSLWRRPREQAVFRPDGAFEVLLEEFQRTACRPREVCVEVVKEYPESTSRMYSPRCVALHRCGGCCTSERDDCSNTSHALVNKTLLEVSGPRMHSSIVMVTFVNHTSCTCSRRAPHHSIIRRAAEQTHYPQLVVLDSDSDRDLDQGLDLLALCGPNRVLDESSCECVCRNGLTPASCEPGWTLDITTCECQCEAPAEGPWCPAGQRWDAELCGCVCEAVCPAHQPLDPDTCRCECRQSQQSCMRQGRRFNHNTCSCYRLPCRRSRKSRKTCSSGFYYSEQVCQCIPTYMTPDWN